MKFLYLVGTIVLLFVEFMVCSACFEAAGRGDLLAAIVFGVLIIPLMWGVFVSGRAYVTTIAAQPPRTRK